MNNSITQNYIDVIKNLIINNISSKISNELNNNLSKNKVFNYVNIFSIVDETMCNLARNTIIEFFNKINDNYLNSAQRKAKYHVKAHTKRTILTIFGEITYIKTTYVCKFGIHPSFCYLDRFLGLEKYDYFDPYIKSYILELSANNSIPTVCKMVNDLIGNRISLDIKHQYLTRQSVRNIVLKAKFSNFTSDEKPTPETIYVMADEKFIHTQNNEKKDVMVKSFVVFEGIENGVLKNKQVFAGIKKYALNDCLDYIYKTYDTDKIKTIFLMGDGASWIKCSLDEFRLSNNINIVFALDKFHFKQAINNITKETQLQQHLTRLIINNERKNFINICNELINANPHREEVLQQKKNYILNNWKHILNLYNHKLSCPMESQISHNISYLFTSRPKGYSTTTLSKMLNLRLLYVNKQNIKLLYLNNINRKTILTLNVQANDYSCFDRTSYATSYTSKKIQELIDTTTKTYSKHY